MYVVFIKALVKSVHNFILERSNLFSYCFIIERDIMHRYTKIKLLAV